MPGVFILTCGHGILANITFVKGLQGKLQKSLIDFLYHTDPRGDLMLWLANVWITGSRPSEPGCSPWGSVALLSFWRHRKARSILEVLPNQLISRNGKAAITDYARFRLTDGELDLVLNPIPGQRLTPRTRNYGRTDSP
ncbi:MAG: hypothetical protein WAT09_09940 [Paracoccaceae bacterium]